MNAKTTLTALTTALTLSLTAAQSFADGGYFGVSILDDAQHDYVAKNNRDGHNHENLSSATPFSGFGVAILDGSEHDYVLDKYINNVQTQRIVSSDQDANEFGVAILDDSIHDYVRDNDIGTDNSELIFASTIKNYGADKGNQ